MIYKFKCKATGDVIMLKPQGDLLLRLIGREPAPQGIIEVADMAEARRRLEAAIADAEAGRGPDTEPGEGDPDARQAVGLRQRLWPMLQMLQQAQAAREPVVWGV